jgi:hypothetical protein
MTHVKKIKVAMNLDGLSVPKKIEKGRSIVTEMTGNPNFGGAAGPIKPPLAEITTAVDELEDAHVAAQTGGETETSIQHEKETVLDNKLTQLGHYVEDVANNDPVTAESVVLSAGMSVKKEGEPVGDLPAPENFKADYGSNDGEVDLDCDTVSGASWYIWLASPHGEDNWFLMGDFESVSNASKFTWEGLTPGVEYDFKVAAGGAAGRGAWSSPIPHRSA